MTTTTETTIQIMLQTDDAGRPCLNVWACSEEGEEIVWTTGAGDLMEVLRYASALAKGCNATLRPDVVVNIAI